MKKLPWGIFAGISAMAVFFLTFGFVAIYVVLGAIAAQTNSDFSLFQNWWQTLMFVFDIIFLLILAFSIVMYILRIKASKKGGENDEKNI